MRKNRLAVMLAFLMLCFLATSASAAYTSGQFTIDAVQDNVRVGETIQLSLTAEGDFASASITWKSGNQKLASVDENGAVTGISAGTVTITATAAVNGKNYSASKKITVKQPVSQIQINEKNWNLFSADDPSLPEYLVGDTDSEPVLVMTPGRKLSVQATVLPKNASNKSVTILSEDDSVLHVRRSQIHAMKPGMTTLTIFSESDPDVKVTYKVLVVEPVTKLEIISDSDVVFAHESMQLSALAQPENATISAVNWRSSSVKIATIDERGVLTAVSRGTVTITATAADGSGTKISKRFTVSDRPESVVLKQDSVTMNVGSKRTFSATVKPTSVSNRNVSWSSSDEQVATVSSRGLVQAVSVGTAKITATSQLDGNISASMTVTVVQPVTKITFTESNPSVLVGKKISLTPVISPENATVQAVTFQSSNPKIATVSEDGVVTGIKAGKVRITATAADGSRVCGRVTVQVIQPVEGVHMKYEKYNVGVNGTVTLTAVLEPTDATNKNMTWTVEDPTLLTLRGTTNQPHVTGHRWGTTTIYGVTEDGGFETSVTVHVGDYNKALEIEDFYLENNTIKLTIRNVSDMNITRFYFTVYAYDEDGEPIKVNKDGSNYFEGYYNRTLYASSTTSHKLYVFQNYSQPKKRIGDIIVYITSYRTDTGLRHSIPEGSQPTATYSTRTYSGE